MTATAPRVSPAPAMPQPASQPQAIHGPSPAEEGALAPASAFAAIALAAVSWDGVLSMAGSRALRHALDYRHPYCDYGDAGMVRLMDQLLRDMRRKGAQHLMVEAAEALNPRQRSTAYAVAAEIMRSDGPLEPDERNILGNLATTLGLPEEETERVLSVMDLLHADVMRV
ncbi:MAG: tellurite resistance TerB family protein [Cyanobacteriota bacterium]|nr:tellurite resistance TerB family protein [Cyanobacteriota bacterium]